MPIINTTPQTEGEKLKIANTQMYNMIRISFESNFRILNNSKDPQAILDEHGTDAVALFQASGKVIELLMSINPEYVMPKSTNKYDFHADGTVTYIVPEIVVEKPETLVVEPEPVV